jgi:hypothetical protein
LLHQLALGGRDVVDFSAHHKAEAYRFVAFDVAADGDLVVGGDVLRLAGNDREGLFDGFGLIGGFVAARFS